MSPFKIRLTDKQIVAARGPRNVVDVWQPYHFLVEPEYSAAGRIENVATVFLTNRECAFRCLMCDLWKNTLQSTVPAGAIPRQIDFALQRLPPASQIKLYNSGNFFDPRAIPRQDLSQIAGQVARFNTVIVENHPRLCGPACAEFQQMCGTQLEVAMGLETSDQLTLAALNKQMTTGDFAAACELLLGESIRIRAFVLLRPPGVTEHEGIQQAIESVRFAFDCGVECVAIIPTRSGNGILDQLQQNHLFESPALSSLERVLEECLAWGRGRVLADLWDLARFSRCPQCVQPRYDRLQQMNLSQQILPRVLCTDCGA